jgi:hypothetical protein
MPAMRPPSDSSAPVLRIMSFDAAVPIWGKSHCSAKEEARRARRVMEGDLAAWQTMIEHNPGPVVNSAKRQRRQVVAHGFDQRGALKPARDPAAAPGCHANQSPSEPEFAYGVAQSFEFSGFVAVTVAQ